MTTYQDASWIDVLSDRIEAVAATGTGLTRDRVFLSLARSEDHARNPCSDKFVTVMPPRLPVNVGLVAGAGNVHFDSVWWLTAFGRLGTDQQLRDTQLVRNASLGLAAFVFDLVEALQLETLDNGTGKSPLREPMRLQDIEWHGRDANTGMAWAKTAWSVKFKADLTGA